MKTMTIVSALSILTIFGIFPGNQKANFNVSQDLTSFKRDIQPILESRCTRCHNPKSGLPQITQYPVAYENRYKIRNKVKTRQMPYFGRMTESERDLIIMWVDQGAKE